LTQLNYVAGGTDEGKGEGNRLRDISPNFDLFGKYNQMKHRKSTAFHMQRLAVF
jgi:hypothetical protein